MILLKLWDVFTFISSFLTLTTITAIQAEFRFTTPLKLFITTGFGSNINFDCTTNDRNATTSLWYQKLPSPESRKLSTRPSKLVKNADVFTLLKTAGSDSGAYRCKAVNQARAAILTRGAMLIIDPHSAAAPKYKRYPVTRQFRTVGESVQFKLSATFVLPKIRWRKINGKERSKERYGPITAEHTIAEYRTLASLSSTLTLTNLKVADGGSYQAIGTYNGKEYAVQFDLKVKALLKPKITDISPNHTAKELKEVKLVCNVLALPPADIVWLKDNIKLSICSEDCSKSRFSQTVNKSINETLVAILKISEVKFSDAGVYKCRVNDTYGVAEATTKLTVQIHLPPKLSWQEAGTSSMTVYENNATAVKLQCVSVAEISKPVFKWFKNGKTIHPNENQLTSPNCKNANDGMYFFTEGRKEDLIICGDPLKYEEFSGRYTCRADNAIGQDEINADLNILAPAEIVEPTEEETSLDLPLSSVFNKTCRARGKPTPIVEWWKSQGKDSTLIVRGNSKQGVQLVILSLGERSFGKYSCVARNWHRDEHVVNVHQKEEVVKAANSTSYMTVIIAVVAFAVIGLLVIFLTCLVKRLQKKKMDLEHMRERINSYEIDCDRPILEQVNDMPYDPDWEFSEDRLILGKTLGSGAFGEVVQAEAIGILAFNPRDTKRAAIERDSKFQRPTEFNKIKRHSENLNLTKTTVAVKMLRENAARGENDYRYLASEINIMIQIGTHPNIVNLLGVCTQGKNLLLIMEYSMHGNLLLFLREKRPIFLPTWTKTIDDLKQEYTLVDLVMAALQIARGMEFLASKKCVHRDLAARNVLIGEDYVMKIADFGLARDVYKDNEYVKQTGGLLPMKWMALESLFDGVYTEKSDVWSFGIVLCEIFTLGQIPYPGVAPEDLLDFLSENNRMTRPQHCPPELYDIMRDCWARKPENRPTFQLLTEHIGKILEKNVTKDNPYIAWTLDETKANNTYCNKDVIDDSTLLARGSSTTTSLLSLVSNRSRNQENEETGRCESPLPALPPCLPDITDYPLPLTPVPPTYDEALENEENSAVRKKAHLAAEEERKIEQAPLLGKRKAVLMESATVDETKV